MTITHEDIRDLLIGYAAAIELDQIRVDALPRGKFHPAYNDSMWRGYRRDHHDYINGLLPTVNAISLAMLRELARLAVKYDPPVVQEAIVALLAEASCGLCSSTEIKTATQFFGYLINGASRWATIDGPFDGDPRAPMMRWLSVTDPLCIAKDPECGYGQPSAFVN